MIYTGMTFKAMLATLLNRDDLSNELLGTFSALAVQELETNCFWFQLTSASVPTANATAYAALPSAFIREVMGGFRDTDGTSLIKETWDNIDHWQKYTAGTGEPDFYAIADKVYLYPIPDAVYALPMQYYKSLGFPADTASNAWTTDVWDLTMACALKQANMFLGNTDGQMKAESQMRTHMIRYKGQSGRNTGRGTVRYQEF